MSISSPIWTWRTVFKAVLLCITTVALTALNQPSEFPRSPTNPLPTAELSIPSEPLVRGKAGDYWADIILGKPDFAQIGQAEVVPFKVWQPGGVVVDRSVDPGRAYVWDASNSRILGIDLAKCYTDESPCSADIVLGQPSGFGHSACNGDSGVQHFPHRALASATTLCGLPDVSTSPGEHPTFVNMAVDEVGNLYVPDPFNHRVLMYERPFETDSIADAVWGQQDFTGMTCNLDAPNNPTASSLCFHSRTNYDRTPAHGGWPANGVASDAAGNLWVADSGNNRILRFPVDPHTGLAGTTADLVLGQQGFHANRPGAGLNNLFAPAAVRFDQQGRLYVADTYNHRVLVFNPPFHSGMPASNTFERGFLNPISLEIDPEQRGVWVSDFAAGTIALWDWSGDVALKAIGNDPYQPARSSIWFDGIGHAQSGGGLGFDRNGNLLFSAGGSAQDVLRVSTPLPDTGDWTSDQTDKRFFYPPGGANFMGNMGLRAGSGVAAFNDQLIVADQGRLMFWNGLQTLSNGKPADGVVGDVNYRREWPHCCGDIEADDAGRLWALSLEGIWGFIDVYQLPLTDQATPVHTIWTKDASLPVLGTETELAFGYRMFGITPVGEGEFLWLSDTDNHRVLRIRDPLTEPVVDVILGQETSDGNKCNRRERIGPWDRNPDVFADVTANMLCFPGDLTIDKAGNLWVSDHSLEVSGNHRFLMFSGDLFPANNETVIFAPSATKVFTTHGDVHSRLAVGSYEPARIIRNQHREPFLAATFEPAFNSQNQMAVGFNMYVGGRFVGIYDDPLGSSTEPTAYLNDLASMPVAATFDEHDNLYIVDHNRGRVLVYWNPLNTSRQDSEYQAVIRAVSPPPPFCVLRTSDEAYRSSATLVVDGLPDSDNLQLQIRKIAFADVHTVPFEGAEVQKTGNRIVIEGVWLYLFHEYDKMNVTVRVMLDGQALTAWSPSLTIADNSSICGGPEYEPTSDPPPNPADG